MQYFFQYSTAPPTICCCVANARPLLNTNNTLLNIALRVRVMFFSLNFYAYILLTLIEIFFSLLAPVSLIMLAHITKQFTAVLHYCPPLT